MSLLPPNKHVDPTTIVLKVHGHSHVYSRDTPPLKICLKDVLLSSLIVCGSEHPFEKQFG